MRHEDMQQLLPFRQFFNAGFLGWLTANAHVYEAFEQQALNLIDKGRKHYSARTIVEVLVHHSILREAPGCEFKVRNDVAPDLARVFAVLYPQHVDFWEYRRAGSDEFKAAVRDLVVPV